MTDLLLIPIPQKKVGYVNSSSNLKPVAFVTALSKVVKNVMLSRLCNLMETSDFHFSFKKNLSTDLCFLAFEEVINYYRALCTSTFICFVDIRRAFDRVRYKGLFELLLQWGVNSHRLFIRWRNTTSQEFLMSNGIR